MVTLGVYVALIQTAWVVLGVALAAIFLLALYFGLKVGGG